MTRFIQILFSALLLTVLALSPALPARAFDGRSNQQITIPAEEVVNNDLYLAAEVIIIDGTIKGDLIAAAQTIIINGTVEGDLLAAAREVIIHGTIGDDARMAGAAFLIGENAVIASDLLGASASLETRPGSKIGGGLAAGSGQALLAGDIAGKVMLGSSAIELRGSIEGDAVFALGHIENENQPMEPMVFGPNQMITIPSLRTGLTFGPNAHIGGQLEYIANRDLNAPEAVAAGGVIRTEPAYTEEQLREVQRVHRTPVEQALYTGIDIVRNAASLILMGLFLLWLFPSMLQNLGATIQRKPLPSLGWGAVTSAGFFFSLLVILFLMIVGVLLFGALTLTGLSITVIFSGLLALFGLSVGFGLLTMFVTKLAVSLWGGKVILKKLSPQLAEQKFWPLVLGCVLFATLQAIPILGFLLQMAAALLGLGAAWLLFSEWWQNRQAAAAAVG